MKPLVYVAGPVTGDPWGCVRSAIAASNTIEQLGMLAYLPQLSVLHEIVQPKPYERWVEYGLAMVERCDGVFRLSGESPGADREVERAERERIPVWTPGADATPGGFAEWVEAVWRLAGERQSGGAR